jgi:hypothetical protein
MKSFLKPLESIKEVETPYFLLDKIEQRINTKKAETVPVKLIWATSLSFIMLLSISIIACNKILNDKHAQPEQVGFFMNNSSIISYE